MFPFPIQADCFASITARTIWLAALGRPVDAGRGRVLLTVTIGSGIWLAAFWLSILAAYWVCIGMIIDASAVGAGHH